MFHKIKVRARSIIIFILFSWASFRAALDTNFENSHVWGTGCHAVIKRARTASSTSSIACPLFQSSWRDFSEWKGGHLTKMHLHLRQVSIFNHQPFKILNPYWACTFNFNPLNRPATVSKKTIGYIKLGKVAKPVCLVLDLPPPLQLGRVV